MNHLRSAALLILRPVGNEGCHLADEVFEIAEGFETLDDDVVVDSDVLVNQNITESDRLTDRAREGRRADAMVTEQPHRIAVVRRRAPPLGRAEVLSHVQACLDRGDERVLDTPEPDGIIASALISA